MIKKGLTAFLCLFVVPQLAKALSVSYLSTDELVIRADFIGIVGSCRSEQHAARCLVEDMWKGNKGESTISIAGLPIDGPTNSFVVFAQKAERHYSVEGFQTFLTLPQEGRNSFGLFSSKATGIIAFEAEVRELSRLTDEQLERRIITNRLESYLADGCNLQSLANSSKEERDWCINAPGNIRSLMRSSGSTEVLVTGLLKLQEDLPEICPNTMPHDPISLVLGFSGFRMTREVVKRRQERCNSERTNWIMETLRRNLSKSDDPGDEVDSAPGPHGPSKPQCSGQKLSTSIDCDDLAELAPKLRWRTIAWI